MITQLSSVFSPFSSVYNSLALLFTTDDRNIHYPYYLCNYKYFSIIIALVVILSKILTIIIFAISNRNFSSSINSNITVMIVIITFKIWCRISYVATLRGMNWIPLCSTRFIHVNSPTETAEETGRRLHTRNWHEEIFRLQNSLN